MKVSLVAFPILFSTLAIGQNQRTCDKNISFAVAEAGQVVSRVPKFTDKWVEKNQSKYPTLCFSQVPSETAENYVIVFSTSRAVFNGIDPTLRTQTSTTTSPVSGSGTIVSNYGGVWNYTYSGTETTTTTTTAQVNLPYRDTSNYLYAYSYNQRGVLISGRWRAITTRQGGDGSSTLGYNLGSALGSIHMKERLLKSSVEDISKASVSNSARLVRASQPVPEDTAVGAGKGRIAISADLENAEIYVDGSFVGSAPSTLALKEGPHRIEVKSAAANWERDVQILGDSDVRLKATLRDVGASSVSQVAEAMHSSPAQVDPVPVAVISDPPGAELFLDSKGFGSTPKQFQLAPGSHSIQVVKQGYKDWATKLLVEAGAPATVKAKLER
jgi:hypothetical protein